MKAHKNKRAYIGRDMVIARRLRRGKVAGIIDMV